MTRRSVVLALAVLALAAGGCGGGGNTARMGTPPSTTSPATSAAPEPGVAPTTSAPATTTDLAAAHPRLQKLAAPVQPTAMAVRAGDDAIYLTEKGGKVRRLPGGQTEQPGALDAAPVLDLSGEVSRGGEQGLLGLTFSPDGSKLYVDYTDTKGDTRVVEYGFNPTDTTADPTTRREVLFVHQPYPNHNGGEVVFGPDAKLYVGLGDGGSEYDPDNVGQNPSTLLSKILRIDPQPSGSLGYTVPADNPFVGRAGAPRPETWVWGLRNPWRFSWDRQTGDLWIGDVGQDHWEEVDYLPAGRTAGANLGWSLMDGTHQFHGDNPPGGVLPIFEYTHDGGNCAITGGYVYRGSKLQALDGAYIYGDACTGNIWGLVQQGGKVADQRKLSLAGAGANGPAISSFGEDIAGELYLLDLSSGIYRFEPA